VINTPISLQDLRRNIYVKAKAEPLWRFWGLYVHVCKMETLREAYTIARKNDGSPGADGVTFEAIEAQGVKNFLEQFQGALQQRTYAPLRARRREQTDGGRRRVLRLVQILAQSREIFQTHVIASCVSDCFSFLAHPLL
jgi:RNA-directed DNA polymerase